MLWKHWESLVFFIYCLSTMFIIFFSNAAIKVWPHPWNQISILIACLLPVLLVFIWKIPAWIQYKEFKREYIYIAIIVVLGGCNIFYSEDRSATFKAMSLFLVSGIGVFGVTSCILNTKFRQNFFLCLCLICLLVACFYGLFEYLSKMNSGSYPILLFSHNPIPAGSLLILLLVGPLLLYSCNNLWLRLASVISIFLCLIVIFLIERRGALLVAAGVVFILGVLQCRRLWVAPIMLLIFIGVGFYFRSYLPQSLQRNLLTSLSSVERLEHYLFGAHIFSKKPLFGIGLRAPLSPHLSDYQATLLGTGNYSNTVIKPLKTLENTLLLALVEMGALISISYFLLIVFLLTKLFRNNWKGDEHKLRVTLLLAPLGGFFIHSMTFDSLMFPDLNWIFHSLLGMMSNFDKFHNGLSVDNTAQSSSI